ncbi:zinc finger protein 62 homolog [Culicoides brevitarsis]|uniref:zinc finger protein 62 homolog n=1 Tax=Culicoides brevitarsis TaxID=469753 RepID=UPI00307C7AF9
MDPANLEALCRLCLQKLPKKRKECYEFDESLEKYPDTTFAEAFLSCTGCNIQEHEPQHMCLSCGTELMMAFDLRVKCYQTQEVLDKLFETAVNEEPLLEEPPFEYVEGIPTSNYDEYGQESIMDEEIEYKPEIKPTKIVVIKRKKSDLNIKSLPEVMNFPCEYCGTTFRTESALRIHHETHHSDQKRLECPNCLQLFFPTTFEPHIKVCTMLDVDSKNVSDKRQKAKNSSNRKEVCPICAEIRSQYHIKWHIERSQQIDAEGNVITHPYICDICGARKTAKSYILQHIRNEHLNKFVKCRYCPAEFKHPSTLYSHERREHTDKCPLLKCKYCDFMSATHSSLRVHTYSKHTGEKKHECNICFARFVTKWKLQEHMGSHSTETPFSCEVCDGKFKTKEGVRRHQTKVHGLYKMIEFFKMTETKTCRACLKSLTDDGRNLSDRIEKTELVISYRQAFEKCSGYEVTDDEPQEICNECASELRFSLNFKQKCEETQGKLANWLRCKQEIRETVVKMEIFAENISVEEDFDDRQDDFSEKQDDVAEKQDDLAEKQVDITCKKDDSSKQIKNFKCSLCGKCYKTRQKMLDHMNRSHLENKTETCEYCKRKQHPQELETHLNLCYIARLKTGKTKRKTGYTKKESKVKNCKTRTIKSRICPICGMLESISHISMHIACKMPITKNFVCDICDAQLTTIQSIRRHMSTVHLKLGHKCKKCSESFETSHQLNKHTRIVHPGVLAIIKCEFCGVTFNNYACLRKHRARHTGEKFHKCNVCGKGFVQSTSLKNHMASHSDERPYPCEYCGLAFKTTKHLRNHRKNHETHEYECPVCEKTFSTNQYLREHLAKHHPEYELPPKGAIMNKKYRIMMKEKQLREEALRQGMHSKQVEKIVVTEVPSLEEMLLVQKHFTEK